MQTLRVAVAPGLSRLRGAQAQILETWTQYLQSTSGLYYQAACRPSPFWVASEQRRWPCYNLAAVYLSDGATPPAQLYPAGAVFAQITYERGGISAVRALFAAGGPPTFQSAMEQLFGEPWSASRDRWRRRVQSYGTGSR